LKIYVIEIFDFFIEYFFLKSLKNVPEEFVIETFILFIHCKHLVYEECWNLFFLLEESMWFSYSIVQIFYHFLFDKFSIICFLKTTRFQKKTKLGGLGKYRIEAWSWEFYLGQGAPIIDFFNWTNTKYHLFNIITIFSALYSFYSFLYNFLFIYLLISNISQ